MNVVGHPVDDDHLTFVIFDDPREVGVEFVLPPIGDEWEPVFGGKDDVVDESGM